MAFDDLNGDQRDLILNLVRQLATGDFAAHFTVTPLAESKYLFKLKGVGGAADIEIVTSENNQFKLLTETGYVSMTPSESRYLAKLTAKAYAAYEEYKSLDFPPGIPIIGLVPGNYHVSNFDDALLVRIATRSEKLLTDLRKNFELYRRQASLSFIWTLVISTVGMILLSSGVALSLIGKAGTVNLASISGVLTEFLAAIFFKQNMAARNSQDRCHEDLLKRQRILDLVELTRLISDPKVRDAVTQDLIKSFVLGSNNFASAENNE